MQALGLEHDMNRVLFLIALPCLTVATAGVAQMPTFIPGGIVRIQITRENRIQGTFASQTAESITVALGEIGEIRSVVPVASITIIQVREARSRRQGAILWMVRGLSGGPVVGMAAGMISGWKLFLPVTAVYSAAGAAGGAAYGAMKGTERWHTVYSGPRVVGQP